MNTWIALLRGVNVGGRKPVAMADLRRLVTILGFSDVQSLLQSGNLVFRGALQATGELERLLERETEKRLGLRTDFTVRTVEEWGAIIAGNPFRDEGARDPSHLVVIVFKDDVIPGRVDALRAAFAGPEVIQPAGRHAYIVYPNGIGRSRLTSALIEKTLGTRSTGRNWNTVRKLGALAEGR